MSNYLMNREISIIYDLLFGSTDKMAVLRERIGFDDFNLPVQIAMVVKINDYSIVTADKSEFRKEEIRHEVFTLINKFADKFTSDIISAIVDEDTIVVFFAIAAKKEKEIKDESIRFGKYIKENLEKEVPYTFSIGIGRRYTNIKGLLFSYEEALNACKRVFFMGENRVIYIDDIVLSNKDVPIIIYEMEAEFLNEIRTEDIENINKLFKGIVNSIIDKDMLDPEIIKIRVMDLAIKTIKEINKRGGNSDRSFYKFSDYVEKILKVETKKELLQLIDHLSRELINLIQHQEKRLNSKREIKKAIDFIKKNFKEDLSLKQVSQEVGLSLYYFSHLFKEEVGETFVSYLNRVRIMTAKKLLQETDLNISEICYQVGYNDPNYFTRVFKEYEKMTPSEYRLFFHN